MQRHKWANNSLQPMPVGRLSSAFAVDILHPAWLSSGRLPVTGIENKVHRQTLRMSLALVRNGAVIGRSARSGRRAEVRAAAHRPGPDPEGLPMGAPTRGKPGGLSRPDVRAPCHRSLASPAAHPQRWGEDV